MGNEPREYLVLTSPWDHAWDVFVLDPVDGLIGAAAVATLGEADDVARRLVSEHTHRVPERVRLSFLRR